ncbi:MarR family winged helix-turn-helix transcriptional regulator [Paeniglutamicibacter gangotriensis]|uniref:MarR family transcriptional regulator n=2 Tax=Paeniglutamicibacter gangotriensis TaxID=254787 RepID=A0A5B0E7V0_9MICC|nr:MarR family transcriptional regulator [Paeniglutamicibacter gangotriensis]KAA0974788.1 MarR family transcriptional regulator [Paeniglutamicibacter gangotriensis]
MNDSRGVPNDESDPLDQMICFALYAAARATNRCYVSLLKPWGLTYPQYLVLVLLWTHRSLSVKDVAEHLKLDSGTTSPLIRRLEARGFLTKERSVDDERTVIVSMTESGTALRKELAHIPGCVAEATKLTLADSNSALSLLRNVATNLASAPAPENPPVERS